MICHICEKPIHGTGYKVKFTLKERKQYPKSVATIHVKRWRYLCDNCYEDFSRSQLRKDDCTQDKGVKQF